MSIENFKSPRWTEEEYNILIHHYPEGGWQEVNKLLPHRSRDAICQKARYLTLQFQGHYYRQFNREERAIMEEYYESEGSACRFRFSRYATASQIRGFARRNGLTTYIRHHFTQEENEIIRKHYKENGAQHCLRLLHKQCDRRRTTAAVRIQAERLEHRANGK